MTTSAVQIVNTENLTEYTFNVLATNTNNVIDSYSVFVEKDWEGNFEVSSIVEDASPKYKTFEDETDANIYAMKLILGYKKQYKKTRLAFL